MALYAFDGTWNEKEPDPVASTNVLKFRNAYKGKAYYIGGVGTRLAPSVGYSAVSSARAAKPESKKCMPIWLPK